MTDENYYQSMLKISEEWLEAHRVSESWRVINMLHTGLVRALDERGRDDEGEG